MTEGLTVKENDTFPGEDHRYFFDSRIRYSAVDEDLKLSIGGLIDYFQDCSALHGEDKGIGILPLKKQGQAWIMVSWQIEIEEMPSLGDTVRAMTWAYAFHEFFGKRSYLLTAPDGRVYARGNGIWVMMDMVKGRPVRVSEEIAGTFGCGPRLEMQCASRKIKIPEGGVTEESFCIGRHHIDTNHHVNNGQYVMFASAYLPEHFRIRRLQAEYRMQARLGDWIFPYVVIREDSAVVALKNEEGKVFAVIAFNGEGS